VCAAHAVCATGHAPQGWRGIESRPMTDGQGGRRITAAAADFRPLAGLQRGRPDPAKARRLRPRGVHAPNDYGQETRTWHFLDSRSIVATSSATTCGMATRGAVLYSGNKRMGVLNVTEDEAKKLAEGLGARYVSVGEVRGGTHRRGRRGHQLRAPALVVTEAREPMPYDET